MQWADERPSGFGLDLRYFSVVPERFLDLPRDPVSVQEHGEFAGDGDDCASVRFFRSWAHDLLAVPFEAAVYAALAEDPVRALHQQAAKFSVSGFGDASVRVAAPGLLLARGESEVRADSCGTGWDLRWRAVMSGWWVR